MLSGQKIGGGYSCYFDGLRTTSFIHALDAFSLQVANVLYTQKNWPISITLEYIKYTKQEKPV